MYLLHLRSFLIVSATRRGTPDFLFLYLHSYYFALPHWSECACFTVDGLYTFAPTTTRPPRAMLGVKFTSYGVQNNARTRGHLRKLRTKLIVS